MHGDDDQVVPIADSAELSIKLLKHGTLKVYPGYPHGMCTIHADVINRGPARVHPVLTSRLGRRAAIPVRPECTKRGSSNAFWPAGRRPTEEGRTFGADVSTDRDAHDAQTHARAGRASGPARAPDDSAPNTGLPTGMNTATTSPLAGRTCDQVAESSRTGSSPCSGGDGGDGDAVAVEGVDAFWGGERS